MKSRSGCFWIQRFQGILTNYKIALHKDVANNHVTPPGDSVLKRKLEIFLLLGLLILTSTPVALCITSAPIIYVSGDGSGDFNCDGNADNIQINQALQFVAENPDYTTVYLKGPFTYVIDDTLLIGSNTILEGDSSATIKLVSNAGWPKLKPLIKERNSGSHDITVRGFTIDGNREGNTNVLAEKAIITSFI
jgi:hypothetical protein